MNNEFFKGFQPGGGLRILQWFGLPNTYFRVLNRSFFRACNHFHFLNNVSSGNLNPKDKECFFSELRSFDRGGTLKTSIGEDFSPSQARKFWGSTKGLIPYPPGGGGWVPDLSGKHLVPQNFNGGSPMAVQNRSVYGSGRTF